MKENDTTVSTGAGKKDNRNKILMNTTTASLDNAKNKDEQAHNDPRNYMNEVNRLNRQFPDQKDKIFSLRKEFPDLNIHELRALLLTEIQETPFNSYSRIPPTPIPSNNTTRLVQTLRTPQKVSNPFNKLNIRHQQQMNTSNFKKQLLDLDSTSSSNSKENESGNNGYNHQHHEPTIANIPSVSLSDESFVDIDMQSNSQSLQKPCIQMVNPTTGHQEWRLVEGLEQEIIKKHTDYDTQNNNGVLSFDADQICTKVFIRDPNVGLGMTIRERDGCIYVHALVCQNGVRLYGKEIKFDQIIHTVHTNGQAGPAQVVGIRPGDRILGLNGKAFLPFKTGNLSTSTSVATNPKPISSTEILRGAAEAILNTPDPVVLHVCPSSIDLNVLETELETDCLSPSAALTNFVTPDNVSNPVPKSLSNEETKKNEHDKITSKQSLSNPKSDAATNLRPITIAAVHPFAKALTKRGLLQSGSDESIVTMQLNKFTARTRQWEDTSFLRVDRLNNNKLLAENKSIHLPPTSLNRTHHLFTPSTPILPNTEITSKPSSLQLSAYPGKSKDNGIFIPLAGIRRNLCVRIVNVFVAGDRRAYTVWVYDIELGKEWYAPVRYYTDFKDLRSETMRLSTSIAQIPFPVDGWKVWGGNEVNESGNAKENRCKLLERFLKTLCGIVYTGNIHPRLQEVAVHLQSFLGCDTKLDDNDNDNIILDKHVAINASKFIRKMKENSSLKSVQEIGLLLLLKRSIQRYTNRIFLLPISDQLVSQFIDAMKSNMPTSSQMNTMKKNNGSGLKKNAQSYLNKVKDFLNQIQDLVMDGAEDDLRSISKREEFASISTFLNDGDGTNKTAFFTDCVREQVEIEIYVPLRSSISRHLVHGWRNDDLEMQFKMQELRKRPQSYFKIHSDHQSPSNWESVSKILNMGVGLSTLPCEKLQAIVDASKEVARLYDEEHNSKETCSEEEKNISVEKKPSISRETGNLSLQKEKVLSADDFLPVFIFCVVRAELERPCALCVLLRTLCDPGKRIGEMGYYLASFEAAVSHIGDMDLSEDGGYADNTPLL